MATGPLVPGPPPSAHRRCDQVRLRLRRRRLRRRLRPDFEPEPFDLMLVAG
jgi:hypothetical protein